MRCRAKEKRAGEVLPLEGGMNRDGWCGFSHTFIDSNDEQGATSQAHPKYLDENINMTLC